MKIVISQPMKGLSIEEINKNREKAVKMLTEQGHEVIPTVLTIIEYNGKNESLFCLASTLCAIADEADAVYFMKGWDNARGCQVEHFICKQYNVQIMYEIHDFEYKAKIINNES